jgi:hypothetical protein
MRKAIRHNEPKGNVGELMSELAQNVLKWQLFLFVFLFSVLINRDNFKIQKRFQD